MEKKNHIIYITHSRFIDKVWHAIFRITAILLNALHKLHVTQSNNFRKIIYKVAFLKEEEEALPSIYVVRWRNMSHRRTRHRRARCNLKNQTRAVCVSSETTKYRPVEM